MCLIFILDTYRDGTQRPVSTHVSPSLASYFYQHVYCNLYKGSMHFPYACLGQENKLVVYVGRSKKFSHNEDMKGSCMEIALTTIQSMRHAYAIYNALINSGSSIRRARAFGPRGGIPMEAAQTNFYHAPASRAGIARPIGLPTARPLAEARGTDAPRKGLRVHSTATHKG